MDIFILEQTISIGNVKRDVLVDIFTSLKQATNYINGAKMTYGFKNHYTYELNNITYHITCKKIKTNMPKISSAQSIKDKYKNTKAPAKDTKINNTNKKSLTR